MVAHRLREPSPELGAIGTGDGLGTHGRNEDEPPASADAVWACVDGGYAPFGRRPARPARVLNREVRDRESGTYNVSRGT